MNEIITSCTVWIVSLNLFSMCHFIIIWPRLRQNSKNFTVRSVILKPFLELGVSLREPKTDLLEMIHHILFQSEKVWLNINYQFQPKSNQIQFISLLRNPSQFIIIRRRVKSFHSRLSWQNMQTLFIRPLKTWSHLSVKQMRVHNFLIMFSSRDFW